MEALLLMSHTDRDSSVLRKHDTMRVAYRLVLSNHYRHLIYTSSSESVSYSDSVSDSGNSFSGDGGLNSTTISVVSQSKLKQKA